MIGITLGDGSRLPEHAEDAPEILRFPVLEYIPGRQDRAESVHDGVLAYYDMPTHQVMLQVSYGEPQESQHELDADEYPSRDQAIPDSDDDCLRGLHVVIGCRVCAGVG